MQTEFLLYGATGYTGDLMARAAVQRGLRPILAGRNATALKKLSDEFSLMKGLLSSNALQNFLKRQAQSQPAGPSAEERAQGKTVQWGEVVDAKGRRAVSRLTGPEAYNFTVLTALTVVEHVLEGKVQPGFYTPSQVYGPDLVLNIPGVQRNDEVQQPL